MRRLALLFALICVLTNGCVHRSTPSWETRLLPRHELATGTNALDRWRPLLPQLFPNDLALIESLQILTSPMEDSDAAKDAALITWLDSIAPVLNQLVVQPSEAFQLPAISGPETPFPDHQPLRQLAAVRLASLKASWLAGNHPAAINAAVENLRLARAFLKAQEGIVPLIQAAGVWQISLDGVYWLTRQDDLSSEAAALLQAELEADALLARQALIRAFRGEFTFFTQVVIDRLPKTHDVNLLLSSIGSLGMAAPEAPEEGQRALTVPSRDPLDRGATLQASADDIGGWINAFAAGRHPRGFSALHTHTRLRTYANELGAFLIYATEDAPPTEERIKAADTIVATIENPVGKLFLVITTSQWEPLSAHVFRREAQRSALTGLLAWRRLGHPATWEQLIEARLIPAAPADPFSDGALRYETSPLRARIWSLGENGIDDGGQGSGENVGRPLDLTWPATSAR
ncbi:hypothetical protein [Rariglobus hedericola]|uniref:Uncharacterized protein n=1 Tax=Rariglobus hedericola TaxID=2597822 RepID=A0A556QJ02_9BACT|nr:hypothetical protein [Rariglobus hedericola]TSJ76620.1 hypothetical protein FPL22_10850 [Rariglobus hedericola]